MKTVNIDVLKEHYPAEYQRAYEEWIYRQHDVIGIDWPEFAKEQTKHLLSGSGWDVIHVHYRVAYSQGDGVAVEAGFDFSHTSPEQQDAMRRNFPMCTEFARLGYIAVNSLLRSNRGPSRVEWEIDFGFWRDEDDVIDEGIYKGLLIDTAEQIIEEEDVEKFAEWLHGDVESAESDVYQSLCADAEHQQSEEAFIEWARDFDEEFAVEDEVSA